MAAVCLLVGVLAPMMTEAFVTCGPSRWIFESRSHELALGQARGAKSSLCMQLGPPPGGPGGPGGPGEQGAQPSGNPDEQAPRRRKKGGKPGEAKVEGLKKKTAGLVRLERFNELRRKYDDDEGYGWDESGRKFNNWSDKLYGIAKPGEIFREHVWAGEFERYVNQRTRTFTLSELRNLHHVEKSIESGHLDEVDFYDFFERAWMVSGYPKTKGEESINKFGFLYFFQVWHEKLFPTMDETGRVPLSDLPEVKKEVKEFEMPVDPRDYWGSRQPVLGKDDDW